MTKGKLTKMRDRLNQYADEIQAIDKTTEETEQIYNEMWEALDNAGGIINELLVA